MLNLEDLKLQKDLTIPSHKHVEHYIRKRIIANDLKPGDKLPTKRDFIKRAGVGSKTISEAIEALCKEGLIETNNKGTFVVDKDRPSNQGESFTAAGRDKFMLLSPDKLAYVDSLLESGVYSEINSRKIDFVCRNIDAVKDNTNIDSALMDILCEGFSGLIILPPHTYQISIKRLKFLQDNNISIVFCHRKPPEIQSPLITWKWHKVGEMAADIFIKNEHKRVAYIASIQYEVSEAYLESFQDRLLKYGIEIPQSNIFYGASAHRNIDTEYQKIDFITQLLSSKDKPTAIFCNDASSEILISIVARKLQIQIPEELSILRFGSVPHDYTIANYISSLYVDHKEIGRLAVNTLLDVRQKKCPVDKVVYVPIKYEPGLTMHTNL